MSGELYHSVGGGGQGGEEEDDDEEEEPPALHSIRHNPAQVRIECRGMATCQEP